MQILEDQNFWTYSQLNEEEMNFLNQAILESDDISHNSQLAGNISKQVGRPGNPKSELIIDKDNWFYETVLKELTERMFYSEWNNYYKYKDQFGVNKDGESPPKFELVELWVNYQKQHEFNPLHNHLGLYSFVIFMKIPTHWKEQHTLPISANYVTPTASDFSFVWSGKNVTEMHTHTIQMSPENEGRILFFPAWLHHMVYPFYGTEEERITISGNVEFFREIPSILSSKIFNEQILEKQIELCKVRLENLFLQKDQLMLEKNNNKENN